MSKHDFVKNTYNFDCFTDSEQKKEVKRLENQALLVAELELEALSQIDGLTGTFLDLGCGPGFVTGNIAAQYPNLELLGLDTSNELLEVAKLVVQKQQPRVQFQYGNAYETGLADNSVDFVYSRLLYQHLEHPEKAMKEAKRILKPGGKLCILDVDDQLQLFYPELPSFQALQDAAAKQQKQNGGDRHIARKLSKMMLNQGFKNTQCIVRGVSTTDIGFEAFFDIVVSFKAQIVGESGHGYLQQLTDEVAALNEKPFGLAAVPLIIGQL